MYPTIARVGPKGDWSRGGRTVSPGSYRISVIFRVKLPSGVIILYI